jgi:hydrogenase nickel incorporation protein HypA/HybF
MHEMSITMAMMDAIIDKVGDARVTVVRLEIGKLSGVVVDSIRFCFEVAVEAASFAGASLVVDEPPGQARRRDCDLSFSADDYIALCPGRVSSMWTCRPVVNCGWCRWR